MQKLINLIHTPGIEDWSERSRAAFDELFEVRYPNNARKHFAYRTPAISSEKGVAFAALIHPSNPDSGAYGGTSFVVFPNESGPALVALGVGTQGLSPDDEILGRPGHARKSQAICAWLNAQFGANGIVAWGKSDPTRVELDIPTSVKASFEVHKDALDRYGRVLYALFAPTSSKEATGSALSAMLDLLLAERNLRPRAAYSLASAKTARDYLAHVMPVYSRSEVVTVLKRRRFVILQGPPGTGKTRMAEEILRSDFGGHGHSIQFHPNTTYESFIGGMAPTQTSSDLGLAFSPTSGHLMRACLAASETPSKPYLLNIDEINRADLAKVLGEAIYLLEPGESRSVSLQFDFEKSGHSLWLPSNLYLLGTMNTADRSIANIDIAVRRRFAFVPIWPDMDVVTANSTPLMQEAFHRLLAMFIEHASDESLNLLPGHAYFLETDPQGVVHRLRYSLRPLLLDYLQQGFVAGFADDIEAYLQWLDSQVS